MKKLDLSIIPVIVTGLAILLIVNILIEDVRNTKPSLDSCRSTEICNWKDFQTEVTRRNLPFPELWTQISIQESGWQYQSQVASVGNNVMGFICTPSKNCYAGHMQFPTKMNCIDYLEWWIRKNPPRTGESDTNYIKRRGYNPDSTYCKTVKSIKL